MIAFLITKLFVLWSTLTSPNLDSEEEEREILIEELEDDSEGFIKSTIHKKKDLDIKETNIYDSYESSSLAL